MSACVTLPAPLSKSPRSTTPRSSWMRGPQIVLLPIAILKPLNSGGLWLPVIITPPSHGKWCSP